MITRRRFLAGLGGATLSLPFLESVRFLRDPRARADVIDGPPVYSMFMRQGNGVQQSGSGEEERFWPESLGALTPEILGTGVNADRAVGVLAPFADQLLMVRGTRFAFPGHGCGHSGGINQVLTAADITGEGATSLATGESVDWFISKQLNPGGGPPLTLMSGPQDAYIAHGLSYSGPAELRGAENNPFSAYTDLIGVSDGDPELLEQIALRRMSVNDLVREEMQDLMSKSYLSSADKQRLRTHFESIRDLEVGMSCSLTDGDVGAMQTISDAAADNDNRVVVAKMMLDVIAMAFACDSNRTATLQIGTGNDGTRYYVNGEKQNTFHRISHRVDSDGSDGPAIANADLLHHAIDKIYADIFAHFLGRLEMYPGPRGGTLLEDSVCLWTNDLANGPPHSYSNIPQILAGGAGGFLATGRYIDAGGVTHNKFLNTIINAVGIRKSGGDYYDSFGDDSLEPGIIDAMLA